MKTENLPGPVTPAGNRSRDVEGATASLTFDDDGRAKEAGLK